MLDQMPFWPSTLEWLNRGTHGSQDVKVWTILGDQTQMPLQACRWMMATGNDGLMSQWCAHGHIQSQ